MTVSYALNLRQDHLNSQITRYGNAGILTIYSGTRPATGGVLSGNTALVTFTLGTPFASAASGTLGGNVSITPNLPNDTIAIDGGTGTQATWARGTDSAGNFVADYDVGVADSNADIQLTTTTISTGLILKITSWTIYAGNA